MLKTASEFIYDILEAANASQDIDGFFKAFYPLVGDVDAPKPFVTYRLSELPKPTKNELREYALTFTVVADNYNTSATGYDHLRDYMSDNHRAARFTGGDTSYINEKGFAIADLNYNIKIKE